MTGAPVIGGLVGPRLFACAPGARSAFDLDGLPGGWGVAAKAFVPIVGFAIVAPFLYWLFRKTWQELDREAAELHRSRLEASPAAGRWDARVVVVCLLGALVLTLQEYYGGRSFYYAVLRPWLRTLEAEAEGGTGLCGAWVNVQVYGDLYAFAWWSLTRFIGYVVVPLGVWKILFRGDSILDMAGLRARGVLKHAWIYGACLLVVVPLLFVVSRSPDFATYYPFYKLCSRSWADLIIWELLYILQFLALEIYFRGFWLQGLRRTLGSASIFVMCVPYVMIHYGKPYLESSGAFIAGVALGSLAVKTRSIYAGFLVHITVALLMDLLGILGTGGLPTRWWPAG